MAERPRTNLEDLIGIEHSKLNFFQELQHTIKQLKATNSESENRQREISAILDGITDLMMVLTEDLRIISVNNVFEQLFPDVDPIGKYCYHFFRNGTRPCPECPAFRSMSSDTVCRETAIFRISGRNMQFEMVASPLKSPDLPEHRVLIFKRDVTLEKEYQAKFYQAEKMATIGMLAAGVAHEVNNPLAAVAGFAEGIRRHLPELEGCVPDGLAGDLEEYTDIILQECKRCQDIVRTLLTFSRTTCSPYCALSLNQVVSETMKLLHHHLKNRRKLTVVLELASDLPRISGDEAQLKQVALNLLTNAVDAVGDSGKIVVTTYKEDEDVVLTVEDSGCGIAPENLDKLFEPFFTTKPVGKGIGIGLATCYTIVHNHGGEISVESEQGEGSLFKVRLPVESGGSDA